MLLVGDHEFVDLYFSGFLSENIDGLGLDVLIRLIEGNDLRHRLWLEAVQPVEELHKHFQRSLLQNLYHLPRIRMTLEPIAENDRVFKKEHRSVLERLRAHFLGEVPKEGTLSIGEHEGNILDESFGEEGGESGEGVVRTGSDARGRAIGKDENSVDKVDVLLDVPYSIFLVDFVLLNTASAGQSRCVEDTKLRKRSRRLTELKTLELTSMPPTLVIS